MGLSKKERLDLLKNWDSYKKNNEYGREAKVLKGRSVLIFDVMYVFKSHFIRNEAMSETGVPIGGLKGVLDKIYWLIKKFDAKTVICVFDGKHSHDKRQLIHEDYKSNRNKTKNTFTNPYLKDPDEAGKNLDFQMNLLVRILNELPVKLMIHPKLEADDIIAYICKHYYKEKGGSRIIVSRDKDFYQLIDSNTAQYDPTADKLITTNTRKGEWNTKHPSNIIYYRCIEGDPSDNVEGISGVGTKTIEKYFPELVEKKIDTLQDFIDLIQSKSEELQRLKTTRKILEGTDVIKRNYELMQLQDITIGSDALRGVISVMESNEYNIKGKYKVGRILKEFNISRSINPHRLEDIFHIIRL